MHKTFAVSALAHSTGETKEPDTDSSLKPNPMPDLAALGLPLTGTERMPDSLDFGKHLAFSKEAGHYYALIIMVTTIPTRKSHRFLRSISGLETLGGRQ